MNWVFGQPIPLERMMKRIVACLTFFLCAQLVAQHRIIFFLRSYPILAEHIDESRLLTESPSKAIQQILQTNLPSHPVGGVFATYAGFVEASSPYDGGVVFPRKHAKPLFHFVVTKQIEPILMLGRTVHHWEELPKIEAKVYRIEQLQDSETKLYYWQVTQEELPDNKIPLNAIVLFANPHDVHIPQGISLTSDSPQLQLPDIYINEDYEPVKAALRVLQVNHFFRLITPIYKSGNPTTWEAQVIEQ